MRLLSQKLLRLQLQYIRLHTVGKGTYENGEVYYTYGWTQVGIEGFVDVLASSNMRPENTELVAWVHTHYSNKKLTQNDVDLARDYNKVMYMIYCEDGTGTVAETDGKTYINYDVFKIFGGYAPYRFQ